MRGVEAGARISTWRRETVSRARVVRSPRPFLTPDQLYAALADAGHQLDWTEHVRAVPPTPDDTTTLRVPTRAAVLVTRRLITSRDGRPLALEETRRNGDDTQLTYQLTPTASD